MARKGARKQVGLGNHEQPMVSIVVILFVNVAILL
jgi:hypothetical protein